MSSYYKYVYDIDTVSYTDYFLNTFLKKHNVIDTITSQKHTYVEFDQKIEKDVKVNELNEVLRTRYKFPSISHFLIFYHTRDQNIHADGSTTPRWCSFNLPILGWENTIMNFYSVNPNAISVQRESRYYENTEVTHQSSFNCTNNWVLAHSGLPHNVCGMTPQKPRITLVVRFSGNPIFNLLNNLLLNR
jgi:hypothetical protein